MSREQFEAWARPLWRHREDFDQLIGAAPGTYNNYEVQAAWVAWQESAKQEREMCAVACEELYQGGNAPEDAGVGWCVEEIRARGDK